MLRHISATNDPPKSVPVRPLWRRLHRNTAVSCFVILPAPSEAEGTASTKIREGPQLQSQRTLCEKLKAVDIDPPRSSTILFEI